MTRAKPQESPEILQTAKDAKVKKRKAEEKEGVVEVPTEEVKSKKKQKAEAANGHAEVPTEEVKSKKKQKAEAANGHAEVEEEKPKKKRKSKEADEAEGEAADDKAEKKKKKKAESCDVPADEKKEKAKWEEGGDALPRRSPRLLAKTTMAQPPPLKLPPTPHAKRDMDGDENDEDLTHVPPAVFRQKLQINIKAGVAEDPVQTFDNTPFPPRLIQQFKSAGFTAPSPIQAQSWPIILKGKDMIAVAKTGSGKTLAFLAPAYVMIKKASPPERSGGSWALVLAPTRELAVQIDAENKKFGFAQGVRGLCCYGGTPRGPMIRALQGFLPPHVITATPGRLNDLLEMGCTKLTNVKYVVLDEADRMLDMGFEPQISSILMQVPEGRQTLCFTATWPKEVRQLADTYLKPDRVHVVIGTPDVLTANKAITQTFIEVDPHNKPKKLNEVILGLPEGHKTLVFVNMKRTCEELMRQCNWSGTPATTIHGDKEQWQRDHALGEFVSGKRPILVATDVAARGLDIKGVTHVINYDMPQADAVENYVHRIGRTGRAGAEGTSITFLSQNDTSSAEGLVNILKEAGQNVPPFLLELAMKGSWGKWNKKGGKGGRNFGKGGGKGFGKGGGKGFGKGGGKGSGKGGGKGSGKGSSFGWGWGGGGGGASSSSSGKGGWGAGGGSGGSSGKGGGGGWGFGGGSSGKGGSKAGDNTSLSWL